jgi:hypothetical protein
LADEAGAPKPQKNAKSFLARGSRGNCIEVADEGKLTKQAVVVELAGVKKLSLERRIEPPRNHTFASNRNSGKGAVEGFR